MKTRLRVLSVSLVLGSMALCLPGCSRRSDALAPTAVLSEQTPVEEKQPPTAVPVANGRPFAFPAGKGGELLGQALRPSDKLDAVDRNPGPLNLRAPAEVHDPSPRLRENQASVPRPSLTPKVAPLRPRMLPEDAPLTAYRADPQPPSRSELPVRALVSAPSVDVNQPLSLGFLSGYQSDRVALDDPTDDSSQRAALATALPVRSSPVPFTPDNLPDPFQNIQTIKLRTPPPEDHEPASGAVRLLKQ